MEGEGISWSDVGNWIEHGEKLDEGKYTEDELQEFGQAACGRCRGGNQDRRGAQEQRRRQWSHHAAGAFGDGGILPRTASVD